MSGKPSNLSRSIVSDFPYTTRSAAAQELRALAGTVQAKDRTACTVRTFRHQALLHYNQIPAGHRNLCQTQYKAAVKKWVRIHVI